MALRLVMYGRQWCHLCHDMQGELEALQRQFAFDLEVLDVDDDPALEARLGELVPVLEHAGEELARYRLDVPRLTAWLSRNLSQTG